MLLPITKETFETCLPVGISSHDSLFEKIEPAIVHTEATAVHAILGDAGTAMVQDPTRIALRSEWNRYVCISAFLSVLRQLDLVLTPTGFGVISSDKYAPASKMRVDSLEGQLRNTQIKSYARLLDHLRSPQWGITPQAQECIKHIYNEINFFYIFSTEYTYKDFADWRKDIERADEVLRRKISDAQMDAILTAYRCGDTRYNAIAATLRKFTDMLHNEGEAQATSLVMPSIFRKLEQNLNLYTEWAHSAEYDAFHRETFKNTRDSSAYIFG